MVLVGGYIYIYILPLCISHVDLDFATYQRHYLVINHIGAIRAEHDDFAIRFASAMNQVCTYPIRSLVDIYVSSLVSNPMSITLFHPGQNEVTSYINLS